MATLDELVVRIKADTAQLEREMRKAGVIVQSNSKKMESGFGGVRKSLMGLQSEFGGLSTVLGGVIGAASVGQVIRYSDAWKQAENRLKLVTDSSAELANVQDRLFDISQDTYTGFQPTVALFQRLSFATKELGVSQDEVLTFTEQLNKQLLVGGLSATEASTSIFQLTQAFNKGKLDGDEFRTILESAPPILEALQSSLKKTKGEILAMSAAGLIGPRELIDAVNGMADVTDKRFAGMTFTVEQSVTRMNNAFMRFIGQSEEVSATSGALADSINFIADNMDEFGRVALAVGAILSTRLAIGLGASLALMSPLSLAITAVVGGLTLLATRSSEAQAEQKRHNEALRIAKDLHEQMKDSIDGQSEALRLNSNEFRKNTLEKIRNAQAELAMIQDMNAKSRSFATATIPAPPPMETGALEAKLRNLRLELATLDGLPQYGPPVASSSDKKSGRRNADNVALEKQNELLKNQAKILEHDVTGSLQKVEDQSIQTVRVMEDHFGDALESLMFDFENFGDGVSGVFEGIARDIARQHIINPLTSSIGAELFGHGLPWDKGLLGGLLDGFRASGGPVRSGGTYLVGERGPELFRPNMSGTIIPNNRMGGGTTVVQHFHISPGVPALINQEIRRAAPMIAAQAQQGVFAAIERGGNEASIVGRRG